MIISHLVFLFFVQLVCCYKLHDETTNFSFPCGRELESHRNYRLLNTDRCGLKPPTSRLDNNVGCNFAKVGEFPWMAMIMSFDYGKYEFRCAGVIITQKYILTSARCMQYTENNRTFVRVGRIESGFIDDLETACFARTIAVEKIIRHERFHKDSIYDDIAVIRLKEKIHFYAYELPICLPFCCSFAIRNYEGTKLWVTGWGKPENLEDETRVAGPQLKGELIGMSIDNCSKYWKKYVEKGRGELLDICMWGLKPGVEGLRGVFFGNLGSPLMLGDDLERYFLVGLGALPKTQRYPPPTEIGEGDYMNLPPRYTGVGKHLTWIMDNIDV